MKKFFGLLLTLVVFAGIIGLLFYNKSKMEKKSKTEISTSVPVTSFKVTREQYDELFSFIGTLAPYKEVNVGSETIGKVIGVYFELGQSISRGRTLVKVDDEIKTAALQSAEANYEKAKKDYERYVELYRLQSVQEAQLDAVRLTLKAAESQLSIAERQLSDTRIISPISGTVISKNVESGSVISTGTVIATIANISSLKAKVNIPETEAFKIKVGDIVDVTTEVYPGLTFKGKVTAIIGKADDVHTFPVEVTIPNGGKYPLKAGIFVKVLFTGINKGDAILIPREALVGSVLDAKVYVIENGIAFIRKISIAGDAGDKLLVTGGLSEGEEVVLNGQINLRDSTKVAAGK